MEMQFRILETGVAQTCNWWGISGVLYLIACHQERALIWITTQLSRPILLKLWVPFFQTDGLLISSEFCQNIFEAVTRRRVTVQYLCTFIYSFFYSNCFTLDLELIPSGKLEYTWMGWHTVAGNYAHTHTHTRLRALNHSFYVTKPCFWEVGGNHTSSRDPGTVRQ